MPRQKSTLELDKEIITSLMVVPGIGRKTIRKLGHKLKLGNIGWPSFYNNFAELDWRKLGLKNRQKQALTEWQRHHQPKAYFGSLSKQGIKVIYFEEKNYPVILKETDDPPILLYVKGDEKCLNKAAIAVVGTRQISGYGRQICRRLVPSLVAREVMIVSGFMYGVDVTAQKLADQAGGETIGVLGFGFNQMYPAHHQSLLEEMLAHGQTFISEYPPNTAPQAGLFAERNRIIAGLSLATVVIEAGRRSGSHITARLANEYGRAVCAVPGPITNPFSEGTKWLINEGAKLVTTADEIIEEAGLLANGWSNHLISSLAAKAFSTQAVQKKRTNLDITEFQRSLMRQLQIAPQSADQLAETTETNIAKINSQLGKLELKGLIYQEDQEWFLNQC